MQFELEEVVSAVFCDVMEKLTFMFGEQVDNEDIYVDAEKYFIVKMVFSGFKKGALTVVVPADMAKEIAENVLGVDSDDERSDLLAQDSLKEVVNVLCGRLLTEIEGEEPVFNLSVPEVTSIPSKDWKKNYQENDNMAAFLVDGYAVLIDFNIM